MANYPGVNKVIHNAPEHNDFFIMMLVQIWIELSRSYSASFLQTLLKRITVKNIINMYGNKGRIIAVHMGNDTSGYFIYFIPVGVCHVNLSS